MIEIERLIFNTDLAKRYREFGHIGLNTPLYLIHIDMKAMLSPSLFAKYTKAREYIRSKKEIKADKDGPVLNEDIELARKLSLENQRYLAGAEKIFTEEDFLYNYDEHYPDMIEEKHEEACKGIVRRMTGHYDIPKFMKSKKQKNKKQSEEIFEKKEDTQMNEEIQTQNSAKTDIVIVKKVKGKNKKRRNGL